MYVSILADTLAYTHRSPICYLMATSIYKNIDKIKLRGIFNGMCVNIHLIENGINYYILIFYTLA